MGQADLGPTINAVGWTEASVAIVLLGARLFTRAKIVQHLGWDDYLMVMALLCALVCSALVSVGISYGLGKHVVDIPDPYYRMEAMKYTIIPPNFSILSTMFGKLSIVVFLLRVMGQARTKAKTWFLYGISFIQVVLNIEAIIIVAGFCVPAEKIWNPKVEGWCMSPLSQEIGGLIQASFNALTDLCLALFPILIVWKLNMKKRLKIGLIVVMGMGVFAAAATVVKTVLLQNLPNKADMTWSWAQVTVWYITEHYIIIISGTVPALTPLFTSFLRKPTTDSYDISRPYRGRKNSGYVAYQGNDAFSSEVHTTGLNKGVVGSTTRSKAEDEGSDGLYADASSVDNILHRQNQDSIVKTTEVSLSYDHRSRSRGWPMDTVQFEAQPSPNNGV